jgi:hypothetical protein
MKLEYLFWFFKEIYVEVETSLYGGDYKMKKIFFAISLI